MTQMTYVPYHPGVEQRLPDEDAIIAKLVDSLHRNSVWTYNKYKHGIRDAHAKSHAVLRGTLQVCPDLPKHLSQGLFATPKKYDVIARISSTHPAIRSDQIRGVRAIALKVLGVQGERVLPYDTADTQDFVLVNHSEFPYPDAGAYLRKGMPAAWLLARLPEPVLCALTEGLAAAQLGLAVFGKSLPPAYALFAAPNTHLLGMSFYSSSPLRYGANIAKISLVPYSKSVRRLTDRPVPRSAGPEAHRVMIADFFRSNEAVYEVQAQLCTDLSSMPIEDATVAWSETASPPVGVATITFPKQDSDVFGRRVYADDVLSFNSWRGLAAHRPLGSINRLKQRVYDASSTFRHTMNNAPQMEPRDIAELPHK
jgi:hypothetical protein